MLILPIVNKRRVMNVQIKLKDASKVRKGVCYDDAGESDIIVNREKFSESSFKNSKTVLKLRLIHLYMMFMKSLNHLEK